MPRGNRTGPWGLGSRTGRGLGYCSGFSTPGYSKGPGMGWRRGWARGRGGGFSPYPYYSSEAVTPYPIAPVGSWPTAPDPKEESKYLEQTLDGLKKEIELVEKRLEELASEKQD